MERLTEEVRHSLDKFNKCQLCGVEGDICSFDMWTECDKDDKPEDGNILVICREGGCRKRLDDHPRLYIQVPWSRGGPGKFMLLYGECPHRKGSDCQHPNLIKNGGNGLLVTFTDLPIANIHICGEGGGSIFPWQPATGCEGLPEGHRNHISPEEAEKLKKEGIK